MPGLYTLQYTIIKTDAQYFKYCDILEALVDSGKKTKSVQDEIELLTLLIETYDEQHNTFKDADPVELLKGLLKEHKMKSVDLAKLLEVSEGLVSDILNYKKGLSKESIRVLAQRFKLNQAAFNRPYKLQLPKKNTGRRSSVKNTKNKTVVITKSKSAGNTSFPKKVRSMHRLLGKATLLSS